MERVKENKVGKAMVPRNALNENGTKGEEREKKVGGGRKNEDKL